MRKCMGRWMRCVVPSVFCLFVPAQAHTASPAVAAPSGPLRVFVSVPAQRPIVKRVGGRYVRVETLTRAGKSPCHYEPTPAQVAELTRAKVYFTLGVRFERKLLSRLPSLAPTLRVVDTSAGMVSRATNPIHPASSGTGLTFQVRPRDTDTARHRLGEMSSTSQGVQTDTGRRGAALGLGIQEQEAAKAGVKKQGDPPLVRLFGGGDDDTVRRDAINRVSTATDVLDARDDKKGHSPPHVWLDPYLVLGQARVVRDTLVALDPARRHVYTANWEKLSRELTALDQRVAKMLQPVRGKAFLVLHPAWESFADAYGLKQVVASAGRAGLSANRLARTIEMAKRNKVRAVIVRSRAEHQRARVVARGLRIPVVRIDPVDPALGQDYARGFEQLAKKMKAALSGPT
ncbi:MAG: zinc ABC transporter substrate-binding protein [Myxococcota bacterium]